MTPQELKDEIRYELLLEARAESLLEARLSIDSAFALEYFTSDIIAVIDQLVTIQNKLSDYGHYYTLVELLNQHN